MKRTATLWGVSSSKARICNMPATLPIVINLCGYPSMPLYVLRQRTSTWTTIGHLWILWILLSFYIEENIYNKYIDVYVTMCIYIYIYIYKNKILIDQRHFSVPLRPLVTSKSNPLFSGWLHLRKKVQQRLAGDSWKRLQEIVCFDPCKSEECICLLVIQPVSWHTESW